MIALALIVATTAWFLLLVGAPYAPASLAGIVYAAGSVICHQRPERSFHLDASQLPVCARCLGIYAGAALGALMFRVRPVLHVRWLLALAAVPTIVTAAAEMIGVWFPTNAVRAIAGAPLGAAVAFAATRALHYDECAPRRPTASPRPRTPI